jgi:hypothetical protein
MPPGGANWTVHWDELVATCECNQLFPKYNNSSWWWGAFGNCKQLGGTTDPTEIFNCAWAQAPASDRSSCLRDRLRLTSQTLAGIAEVVAYNGCDNLFAKYNGSSWWWGALGNCKQIGGTTDRAAIFNCAWGQVPANEQAACLRDRLFVTDQTRQGIDIVVAYNGCDNLFAKYNGSSWWWGALGNCKQLGGTTDRAAIFNCAWAQVPASEQAVCLRDRLFVTDQTRQGIDVVVAYNGCDNLFAKYNGSSWWWGALGNCKQPGGTTDRTAIFNCAWAQVPTSEQAVCLRDRLFVTDQTRQGIDVVVAYNGCDNLFAKYNGSSWWWGALGNCKQRGGTTDRTAIFDCAWAQVPASEQAVCLRDRLFVTDQTRQGIDVVVAYNGR